MGPKGMERNVQLQKTLIARNKTCQLKGISRYSTKKNEIHHLNSLT